METCDEAPVSCLWAVLKGYIKYKPENLLPVAAVVQIWCPHLRSALNSRGHTLKIRDEGWGENPQKMIQMLENKLYEVNCSH